MPVSDIKPDAKGTEDIFAELNKDDADSLDLSAPPKKVEKKETSSEDEKGDEDKEDDKEDGKEDEQEEDPLAELEEELEDVDDEKLELITPVSRKAILKEFPKLFEKFPYLEKAYYRDREFTEVFATPKEAKEAAEDSKVLARFSQDMVEEGNTKNVLKMIKDNNPETFNNVVDNYLQNLKEIDESAYNHVLSNVVKNIIRDMWDTAHDSKDEDLATAAKILNKHAFNSTRWTPPQKLGKQVNPDEKEKSDSVAQREREFIKNQVGAAREDIDTRVTNSVKNAIINNIDPKGEMSDFVKDSAVNKALDKVQSLIEKDPRFQKILEKLWDKSAKANFSRASQDEIRNAYLHRAKSLLTPVLKSVRIDALKGMGKRVKKEEKDETGDEPQRERNTERRQSSDKKAKDTELRGMSSFEKLNALLGD